MKWRSTLRFDENTDMNLLGVAERSLAAVVGHQPQIVILEKRISQGISTATIENNKNKEQCQTLQNQLDATDKSISGMKSELEHAFQLDRKKLVANVDECHRKLNSKMAELDMRMQDNLAANKTDINKKVMATQNRISAETGRLKKEIEDFDQKASQKITKTFEDFVERLDIMKIFLLDDSEKKRSVMITALLKDFQTFQFDAKNQFSCLDLSVDQLQQSHSKLALSGPGKFLCVKLFYN